MAGKFVLWHLERHEEQVLDWVTKNDSQTSPRELVYYGSCFVCESQEAAVVTGDICKTGNWVDVVVGVCECCPPIASVFIVKLEAKS